MVRLCAKDVEHVILVFRRSWGDPELGARRRAALDQHPHPRITCLDIDEAGSFGCADWKNPRPDDVGVAFSLSPDLRGAKRRSKRAISAVTGSDPAPGFSVAADYRRNYALIRSRLADELAAGMNVFTHAPWGEYGHEDHVQVFRVLESLRDEIGFTLGVSNYCTERSFPLAARCFPASPVSYIRLPDDPTIASRWPRSIAGPGAGPGPTTGAGSTTNASWKRRGSASGIQCRSAT